MEINDLLDGLEARIDELKYKVPHSEQAELTMAIDAILQDARLQSLTIEEFGMKSQWRLDRAMGNCPSFYDVSQGDFAHRSLPRAPTKRLPQEVGTQNDYVEVTSRLIDIRSKLLTEENRSSKDKNETQKP